jgi:hypothetical protein
MMGQETRNKLTDYWKDHDIKGKDKYAVLTNIIHQEWSDISVKQHKAIKELKTQNLRDHMSEAELIFTALAERATLALITIFGGLSYQRHNIILYVKKNSIYRYTT